MQCDCCQFHYGQKSLNVLPSKFSTYYLYPSLQHCLLFDHFHHSWIVVAILFPQTSTVSHHLERIRLFILDEKCWLVSHANTILYQLSTNLANSTPRTSATWHFPLCPWLHCAKHSSIQVLHPISVRPVFCTVESSRLITCGKRLILSSTACLYSCFSSMGLRL